MLGDTLMAASLRTLNMLTARSEASIQAVDAEPVQPPGMEGLTTIIGWILWAGGLILFIFFIFGLVQAGRNRRGGNEVEAPIWPLAAACILGASGVIWNTLTGA